MGNLPSSYVVVLLSAATVVYILNTIWRRASHKILAQRAGCKPAFTRPYRLPLGIDNLARTISSILNNTMQNDDFVIYEEIGCRSTWLQNILGEFYHVTADPENIKAMLATQFDDFELGPLRRDQLGPLIGHGIFTSDGKDWQQQRSILRPQFTRTQISNLTLLEAHVQQFFQQFENAQADSWTREVDLGPLFFNLTLDAATEFLFGQSVDSQRTYRKTTQGSGSTEKSEQDGLSSKDGSKDWSSFGRAFDRANATIALRGMLMDFYYLYKPSSFARDCKEVQQFADYFVQRALSQELGNKDGDSQTGAYVFLRELVKTTRDPYVLRSQLLNILLAGRDTTAGLLGWTFFLLARHPAYCSKLHRVVVETFGAYSPDTSSITFESLKACHHLQHLLSEVLRLHPVVPENGRRAVRNTKLPRGGGADGQSPVFIRKGEDVIYSVNVMHHRKDLWGDDAHEFAPERWVDRKHGWEYLPFNGGPRICLGQQFALTEAAYVVVRTLQRYGKIENMDPETVTKHQYALTTAPAKVSVRLFQAN
ncbi:hypothetical protein LMH87_002084 [Akanthomyces muscarius]|uniref:Cytochrome P450 n=1 Tax=Akanthomyces muscarius TaxID=2231603 RepID=A0A9W8Q5L7_AKAMU|nr:hypothetical protein LMH87_002084 [Akanthomyces muscarius]KAJ4147572.1 hypothetical protein LMH87_002084 [Akanthomyces muscarius]